MYTFGLTREFFLAERDNDAVETQVDTRCEQRRRNSQGNEISTGISRHPSPSLRRFRRNLHEKITHQKWIQAQLHAPNVAYRLARDTDAHGHRVLPCLVPHAEPRLCEQEEGEAGRVDCGSGHVGPVCDYLPCLRAFARGAVFAGHGYE